VQDADNHDRVFGAFALLGLLVNYNKFEFQNPYQLRLQDFVNEAVIVKVVNDIGNALVLARNKYIAAQDDQLQGWNINSTLSYLGLGVLAPIAPKTSSTMSEEEAKMAFADLYVHCHYERVLG